MVRFTEEDSWRGVKEKKDAAKYVAVGKGGEKTCNMHKYSTIVMLETYYMS